MSGIRHIVGTDRMEPLLRGGVIAIGNFDGVHRGHQAVLECALTEARNRGAPALVLTFEPHPRTMFAPAVPLFILTPPAMKARLLGELGFAAMVEQRFDADFASLSAECFITELLVGRLGISHAVTGFDFHFGKGRQGGPAFLMAAGKRHGFGVTLVDPFRDEAAETISSSRVRRLIASGEVAEAAGLLGYRFTVEGAVSRGRQLGRALGFPTANVELPPSADIRHGIYAVRLRRSGGGLFDGVASFGRRPTVEEEGRPLLETHVFDFSGDLYGQNCAVSFFGFLRGEQKFAGLEPLVEQMRRDEVEARAMLSAVRPLSALDARLAFDG